MSENFSARLKKFRAKKGLSQDEMGAMLGVGGRYVSMLETGKAEVEESSSIAKLFNLLDGACPKLELQDHGRLREEGSAGYGPARERPDTGIEPWVEARLAELAQRSGQSEKALIGYAIQMYVLDCEAKNQVIIPIQQNKKPKI